ncbi:toxin-antitoxin system YwqK family antitoxin [Tenacibaculum sp. C7A-26P2]|uniref:toxin-antitoxin system YwqK family antitoxin n=1 Tax=Tenacibaculum sp. C7A-26P2 TaxID=3447504 RepID=UPI003F84B743
MKINKTFFSLLVVCFLLKSCTPNQDNDEHKIDVLKSTHKNGKLKDVSWVTAGNTEGKSYFFKDNGEIYAEFNLKGGFKNGKAITYDKGLVLSEENYLNDKLNGDAKYYDNGKLEIDGYFRDDLKVGIWNYFYNTKLVLSELYERGNLQQVIYKDVKHFENIKNIPPKAPQIEI